MHEVYQQIVQYFFLPTVIRYVNVDILRKNPSSMHAIVTKPLSELPRATRYQEDFIFLAHAVSSLGLVT